MAKSTLIITNDEDVHADVILKRMNERSLIVERLDSTRLMENPSSWRIGEAVESVAHQSWIKNVPDVIWYRKIVFPDATDFIQSFIGQELEGLMQSLIMAHDGVRWVNHPLDIEKARAKIAQLQRAKEFGFRIPDTLVTTDLQALIDFSEKHVNSIIAKPIKSQVIGVGDEARFVGTRKLNQPHFKSALAQTPCYAQQKLRISSEIRVIVFGDWLFAFRQTPLRAVDDLKQLELDEIDHRSCSLDSMLTQRIIQFVRSYHLEFGALDFAVIDADEPVFLELNPNGQWLWLQYVTGINLEDPFIDFLVA